MKHFSSRRLFPFCVEEASGIWDQETRFLQPSYGGQPSMSAVEWQPAVGAGTAYPVGMTLMDVVRLYKHAKSLRADFSINCKGEAGWVSWPDDVDGEWPAAGINATFTSLIQPRFAVDEDGLICGNGSLASRVDAVAGGPTENSAGGAFAYINVDGASASAFMTAWSAILAGEWDGGEAPEGEEMGLYTFPTTWSNYASADVAILLFESLPFAGGGPILRIDDVYYPRVEIATNGQVAASLSSSMYEPEGVFNQEATFAPSGDGYDTTWSHHSREFGSFSFGAQSTKIDPASTFSVTFLAQSVPMFIAEESEGITGGSSVQRDGRLEVSGLDSVAITVNEYFAYDPFDGAGPIVGSTTGSILRQL